MTVTRFLMSLLLGVVIMTLTFGFIGWNFNPGTWPDLQRLICLIFGLVVGCLIDRMMESSDD